MITGEKAIVERDLQDRLKGSVRNTAKSVASICRVEKAAPRKWVPKPLVNGSFDWGFISWILESLHGSPRHGNPEDPLDCLLYLMLTRKTPIELGRRLFRRLKCRYSNWDDLLAEGPTRLTKLLYGSGLEETRSHDIVGTLEAIKKRMKSLDLERLRRWNNAACERFLTSLPGIGTKTARCVMMYTLNRGVFPADAHCIRVLARIGVIEKARDHRDDQEKLSRLIPPDLAYRLHVNLVAHGQNICTAINPRCQFCPLRKFCTFYRAAAFKSSLETPRQPTAVDLFCGAGGTSFGLSMAGYRVLAAVDIDPWACQTFRLNHPEVDPERVICRDIHKVHASELLPFTHGRPVDLLVGGPPCQGFSMIGARIRGTNGEDRFIDDPRNELYKEFIRMVREIKPRVVFMENVPGLFSLKGGYYRNQILEDLDHEYRTEARLVDARAFGVPQYRVRALFIGVSTKHFGQSAEPIIKKIIEAIESSISSGPTLKTAIADLPPLSQNDGSEVMKRPRRAGRLSGYATALGAAQEPLIFNHVARPLNVRDQLLYSLLAPGEEGHDAVERHNARHLMVYRDDVFHDKYRRLVYEKAGPTMMAHLAKDGHMFIHPDPNQNRNLTVREAARIQSFPDDFIFYGPRTYQFQHVGNAVPPLLSQAVGNIIRKSVLESGFDW